MYLYACPSLPLPSHSHPPQSSASPPRSAVAWRSDATRVSGCHVHCHWSQRLKYSRCCGYLLPKGHECRLGRWCCRIARRWVSRAAEHASEAAEEVHPHVPRASYASWEARALQRGVVSGYGGRGWKSVESRRRTHNRSFCASPAQWEVASDLRSHPQLSAH